MNQCKYLKRSMIIITLKVFKKIDDDNNYIKIFKKIDDDNNYIRNILKRSMMIIITSKIFEGIGGNT